MSITASKFENTTCEWQLVCVKALRTSADNINRLHVQVRSKQAAHLGHMLVVGVHAVVGQFNAVFPLTGADGRRSCPVVSDWRGHRLHSGLATQRCLACANTQQAIHLLLTMHDQGLWLNARENRA